MTRDELFAEIGRQAKLRPETHRGRPALGFDERDMRLAGYLETDTEAAVAEWARDTFAMWADWMRLPPETLKLDIPLEIEVVGWETGQLQVVLLEPTPTLEEDLSRFTAGEVFLEIARQARQKVVTWRALGGYYGQPAIRVSYPDVRRMGYDENRVVEYAHDMLDNYPAWTSNLPLVELEVEVVGDDDGYPHIVLVTPSNKIVGEL